MCCDHEHGAGQRSRRGVSLLEWLLAFTVIVIAAALMLPFILGKTVMQRQTQCASNQVQLYKAWTMASAKMPFPVRAAEWPKQISPFLERQDVLLCPEDKAAGKIASYGMNSRSMRMADQDLLKTARPVNRRLC